ncbi:MAG: ABC transporter permease subunit [Pseudomonadota bacterium]
MFEACADPTLLGDAMWMACYLTTPKHQLFYWSFGTVLLLLALVAPLIMALGFLGALAKRSSLWPLRRFGDAYTAMVRGIPDIIFFLFVPIALDQGIEYLRHVTLCPEWTEAVYQGNDFVVCDAAKAPLSTAAPWVHTTYNFTLALVAFAIVFGAFAANIIDGALKAVPKGQLETAAAYGMTPSQSFWRIQTPQMWVYALPGLSNLWMILVKATPLLFLLGVEDIVYWARELGGSKTDRFSAYPHPDWRMWYFLGLLVFYLTLTWVSEMVLGRVQRSVARGQASAAGAAAGGLGR